MIRKIIILLVLLSVNSLAVELLLFKPLTANPFEARTGFLFQSANGSLRLDIGASYDLLNFKTAGMKSSVGADFFTYTRLRHEGNFKFPVETSDYFFGLNYAIKFDWKKQSFIRFRLAHISSHLVDGYTDNVNNFIREPIVFSREFIDLVFAQYVNGFRYYLGLNYIFSTIPKTPNRVAPQLGFDNEITINDYLYLVSGIDFKLIGIDNVWRGNTAVQFGLKFVTSSNYGIFVGAYYYQGRSMHGQFFNDLEKYFGLGFQLLFL